MAVVVDDSSTHSREVQIMTKIEKQQPGPRFRDGSEKICLFLKRGDGYLMDGTWAHIPLSK